VLKKLLPAPGAPTLLSASWLINTIGTGLYLPSSALFFTRVAGMSAQQVGIGLSIAGVVALATSVPIGQLVDRLGARRIYSILLLAQAIAMTAFSTIRSFPIFVAVAIGYSIAYQGSSPARGALIASVGQGGQRVALRAYLRVVTNIGISIGAGLAAISISHGTRTGYTLLLLGNAATFIGAAIPLIWLRPEEITPRETEKAPPWQVFSDHRYVRMSALSGVMAIQGPILSFAVPLWVVGHTNAPSWMTSAIVIVNTIMIVALQIKVSKGSENTTHAATATRRAGLALLLACIVLAGTHSLTPTPAILVLLVFAVLLSLGELWTSAGTFGLSYNLAPDGAHGQYLGFYSLGQGIAAALSPWLLSALCLSTNSGVGWLVLGVVFACAGLTMPLAVRVGKSE
jgi:MFS family permease